MQTLSGLAELFSEYRDRDPASAMAVYKSVSALLPFLGEAIYRDISEAEVALKKLESLPADHEVVVKAGQMFEDLFHVRKGLIMASAGMDIAMIQKGLISPAASA